MQTVREIRSAASSLALVTLFECAAGDEHGKESVVSVELWSAILNPSGPNYHTWLDTLGGNRVPLKSSASIKADLGGKEKDVEVYLLNLAALTLDQRARLLGRMAKTFGVPIYEVEAELNRSGFPIRAADVIVSFDMRAFV